MEEQNLFDFFGLPATIFGNQEWIKLETLENEIGAQALLDEIIDKQLWTNSEICWILKRMIYFYGKKDAELLKIPSERLFMNIVDVLRCFFLVLDNENPGLDDNLRAYICSKLADSTWGINTRTRNYLEKL